MVDRAIQDDWANSIIKEHGPCPEKYEWVRYEEGYHCEKGGHVMTDELLREGKGGIFGRDVKTGECKGPFYPDPNDPKKFRMAVVKE